MNEPQVAISVQNASFDPGALLTGLHARQGGVGAVVSFVGYVRDFNQGQEVAGMVLEHYPGMTEKALRSIVDEAVLRWPLLRAEVLHRVGPLSAGEPIVFVGVSSAHRAAAFEACHFIIDYLKTRAPFWKREATPEGNVWVAARETDQAALQRWEQDE